MSDFKPADYFAHFFGAVTPLRQRANIAFEASQSYAVFGVRSAVVLNSSAFGVLALLASGDVLKLDQIYCSGIFLIFGVFSGFASAVAGYFNLQYISQHWENIADITGKEISQMHNESLQSQLAEEIKDLRKGIDERAKKINCSFFVALCCISLSYGLFIVAIFLLISK